jgi:hypothetical protein
MRTPIEILKLEGNGSNLHRAIRREAQDQAKPAPTADRAAEIAAVDALILQALKTCRRGHTTRKKSNPAFSHLATLVKTREALLRGFSPAKKTTSDLVNEADKILGLHPVEVN